MASSDDPNRFLQRAGSDNRARQQPQPQGPGDRMSNWARAARLTDAHNMRGVPPEYQRSSTDAIQIPEYMRAETLMKQLVAHQKFTTDQLAFLDTQKMSQQQASILCDLCRNHMKKDGLGDDVVSKNMRIISTAIAHHTFEELNPNLEEFFESTSNRNEGNSHADAPITHDQAIDANRLMEDFKSTVKPSVLENLSHRLTYSLHGRSPEIQEKNETARSQCNKILLGYDLSPNQRAAIHNRGNISELPPSECAYRLHAFLQAYPKRSTTSASIEDARNAFYNWFQRHLR